jgi:hypothetical protein
MTSRIWAGEMLARSGCLGIRSDGTHYTGTLEVNELVSVPWVASLHVRDSLFASHTTWSFNNREMVSLAQVLLAQWTTFRK